PATAHASVGLLAQTPQIVAVVGRGDSLNVVPSQWVRRPFSPDIHTSFGPLPVTHQNESSPPGARSFHVVPSKWRAMAAPPLPSGPPTTKTSSGAEPHTESTAPPRSFPS